MFFVTLLHLPLVFKTALLTHNIHYKKSGKDFTPKILLLGPAFCAHSHQQGNASKSLNQVTSSSTMLIFFVVCQQWFSCGSIAASILIYLCAEFDVCLILLSVKHEPP